MRSWLMAYSEPAYSDKRSRVLGCGILITIGAAVVLLAIAWLMGRPYTSSFPRAFDSAVWKAADTAAYPSDKTRCGMIADLQLRIGLVGKSRSELSNLLGEPVSVSGDPSASYWPLCPSFVDVWVLRVRWENDRALEAVVHDT